MRFQANEAAAVASVGAVAQPNLTSVPIGRIVVPDGFNPRGAIEDRVLGLAQAEHDLALVLLLGYDARRRELSGLIEAGRAELSSATVVPIHPDRDSESEGSDSMLSDGNSQPVQMRDRESVDGLVRTHWSLACAWSVATSSRAVSTAGRAARAAARSCGPSRCFAP